MIGLCHEKFTQPQYIDNYTSLIYDVINNNLTQISLMQ